MAAYPYDCVEQATSRAVALGDLGRWQALAGAMPTYLDDDGLLRYWPSERLQGSPELTAYVLAITAANGFAIPEAPRAKMVAAPQALVEGRLTPKGHGPSDTPPGRIAAPAAPPRHPPASA